MQRIVRYSYTQIVYMLDEACVAYPEKKKKTAHFLSQ